MLQPREGDIAFIVLDTNAVMDWLVFRDPTLQALAGAIERRDVVWLTSAELRDELAHVLSRGVAAAWRPDAAAIIRAVERGSTDVAQPAAHLMFRPLRCSDADDQKFIDLALAHGAQWLVSRDRALLKLAKKAMTHGLTIVTPARWAWPAAGA